jgi:hypothetical protein
MFKYLLFLLPCLAQAELITSFGAGKGIFNETPFERVASLGEQFNVSDNFFLRPEVGYFNANNIGQSSAWYSALLGVQVNTQSGLNTHLAIGPSYLQTPDTILGGPFQFSSEIGLGLQDKVMNIGVAFKHLSSAGIELPNSGRDFIVLQLGLKGL